MLRAPSNPALRMHPRCWAAHDCMWKVAFPCTPSSDYLEHVKCQLLIVLPLLHGLLDLWWHGDRTVPCTGGHVVKVRDLDQLLSKVPGRYLRPLCIEKRKQSSDYRHSCESFTSSPLITLGHTLKSNFFLHKNDFCTCSHYSREHAQTEPGQITGGLSHSPLVYVNFTSCDKQQLVSQTTHGSSENRLAAKSTCKKSQSKTQEHQTSPM